MGSKGWKMLWKKDDGKKKKMHDDWKKEGMDDWTKNKEGKKKK